MKINLNLVDLPTLDLRADIDQDSIDELADSLRDHGQLQSIGVRPTIDGRYEVVFGARRTRAAKTLGWLEIRADVLTDADESTTAAKKLIENIQRQNLTPIEEAYGLVALIGDEIPNVRKLQHETGKSRDWVKSRLDMLSMPEELQAAIQAGVIGVGVAQALASVANDDLRCQYLEYAIDNNYTASQAALLASQAAFAEQGIASMSQSMKDLEEMQQPPDFVDQKWNCFCCGEPKSFRHVNMLVVCSGCQSEIAVASRPSDKMPEETLLDKHVKISL